MIKRRIPDDWLLPDNWHEDIYGGVGFTFPMKVIGNKFVIIDDSGLQPQDIQAIKDWVLSVREVITDITQ